MALYSPSSVSAGSALTNSTNCGWKIHWWNLWMRNPGIWRAGSAHFRARVFFVSQGITTQGKEGTVTIVHIKLLLSQRLINYMNAWSGHCLWDGPETGHSAVGMEKHHVRALWRACGRPSAGDPGDNSAKPCREKTGRWWQKAAVCELMWLPLYTQANKETWGYVCIYINEYKYIKILTELLLVIEWLFAPCYLFVGIIIFITSPLFIGYVF